MTCLQDPRVSLRQEVPHYQQDTLDLPDLTQVLDHDLPVTHLGSHLSDLLDHTATHPDLRYQDLPEVHMTHTQVPGFLQPPME